MTSRAAHSTHAEFVARPPTAVTRKRESAAAVHRISAASCYQKAGDPSRATNLFRAALAGPLRAVTRQQVEDMLSECLALLTRAAPAKKPGDVWEHVGRRRARA